MFFLNWFYPQMCFGCKKNLQYTKCNSLCYTCWKEIGVISKSICYCCGKYSNILNKKCLLCRNKKFYFDELRFVGVYQKLLKELLLEFKFSGKTHLTFLLSELILRQLQKFPFAEKIDIIIPVPLHFWRLWERGYNQSGLIANYLGKKIKCDCIEDNLYKVKNTVAQSSLSLEERALNIKNAFALASPEIVSGKNILLVDDIFTSGNTIQECSFVLKQKGNVKNIYVAVVARS